MIHGYHSATITTCFSHSTILMMPWNFPRMAWQKRAAWRRLTHEAPSALRKTPIFWGQARTVHGLELRSELIAGSWVDLWSYQELSWVICEIFSWAIYQQIYGLSLTFTRFDETAASHEEDDITIWNFAATVGWPYSAILGCLLQGVVPPFLLKRVCRWTLFDPITILNHH